MIARDLAVRCDGCTQGFLRPLRTDFWPIPCPLCGGRGSMTYVRVATLLGEKTVIVRRLDHGKTIRVKTAVRIVAKVLAVLRGPKQPKLLA